MVLLPHGLYRFHSSFLHLVLLISTSILAIHHTAQTPRSLHVDGEHNKAPSPDSMRFSQKCHRHSQIGTTFASPTEPRLLSRLRPPRLSVRAQTEPLESACCTMKQDRHNRLRRREHEHTKRHPQPEASGLTHKHESNHRRQCSGPNTQGPAVGHGTSSAQDAN
jgi:hypothetical protein